MQLQYDIWMYESYEAILAQTTWKLEAKCLSGREQNLPNHDQTTLCTLVEVGILATCYQADIYFIERNELYFYVGYATKINFSASRSEYEQKSEFIVMHGARSYAHKLCSSAQLFTKFELKNRVKWLKV